MNIMDDIAEALAQFGVEAGEVDPAATLGELGLDSLAQVEFADVLQERFQVAVSDDDMSGETTLGDLLTLLTGRTAS
ncbi:acyl carrier protein [Streptomyces sp. NPDC020799]|uniref:acyl carrier protein n=1 Tax=Streptomyces sp. NPDC020799 TaxID=3365091 RepID=UPI0037BDFC34